MNRAYNKVTRQWIDTEDGSELKDIENWIINPVFEDEHLAMEYGQDYWIFEGSTIRLPTPAEYAATNLQIEREKRWKDIQAERDRRKNAGVYIPSVKKWFHTDDSSRIQHLGLVMLGASLPPGIMWKTLDGTFIQMSAALAAQIFQSIAAKDVAIFAVAEQHKLQVYASNKPAEYDFLTTTPTWPTVFGD